MPQLEVEDIVGVLPAGAEVLAHQFTGYSYEDNNYYWLGVIFKEPGIDNCQLELFKRTLKTGIGPDDFTSSIGGINLPTTNPKVKDVSDFMKEHDVASFHGGLFGPSAGIKNTKWKDKEGEKLKLSAFLKQNCKVSKKAGKNKEEKEAMEGLGSLFTEPGYVTDMSKLKVGDKVKVKSLEELKEENINTFLLPKAETILTVTGIEDDEITVEEDIFSWNHDWLVTKPTLDEPKEKHKFLVDEVLEIKPDIIAFGTHKIKKEKKIVGTIIRKNYLDKCTLTRLIKNTTTGEITSLDDKTFVDGVDLSLIYAIQNGKFPIKDPLTEVGLVQALIAKLYYDDKGNPIQTDKVLEMIEEQCEPTFHWTEIGFSSGMEWKGVVQDFQKDLIGWATAESPSEKNLFGFLLYKDMAGQCKIHRFNKGIESGEVKDIDKQSIIIPKGKKASDFIEFSPPISTHGDYWSINQNGIINTGWKTTEGDEKNLLQMLSDHCGVLPDTAEKQDWKTVWKDMYEKLLEE